MAVMGRLRATARKEKRRDGSSSLWSTDHRDDGCPRHRQENPGHHRGRFGVRRLVHGDDRALRNHYDGGPANWSGSLPAFWSVVYGVLIVLYYILLEGYRGQTVGKMLLGIKVVREDNGEVPGLGAATIRTLLRIIDGIFSYVVAFVTVLISRKNQRLGDMAAHTLVVRK